MEGTQAAPASGFKCLYAISKDIKYPPVVNTRAPERDPSQPAPAPAHPLGPLSQHPCSWGRLRPATETALTRACSVQLPSPHGCPSRAGSLEESADRVHIPALALTVSVILSKLLLEPPLSVWDSSAQRGLVSGSHRSAPRLVANALFLSSLLLKEPAPFPRPPLGGSSPHGSELPPHPRQLSPKSPGPTVSSRVCPNTKSVR